MFPRPFPVTVYRKSGDSIAVPLHSRAARYTPPSAASPGLPCRHLAAVIAFRSRSYSVFGSSDGAERLISLCMCAASTLPMACRASWRSSPSFMSRWSVSLAETAQSFGDLRLDDRVDGRVDRLVWQANFRAAMVLLDERNTLAFVHREPFSHIGCMEGVVALHWSSRFRYKVNPGNRPHDSFWELAQTRHYGATASRRIRNVRRRRPQAQYTVEWSDELG